MPLALFFKIPSKSKTSLDTLLTSSPLPWVFINSSILVSPSNPPAYFVQPRLSAIKCLDEHPLHTVITMPLRYAFQKGEKGESQSVFFSNWPLIRQVLVFHPKRHNHISYEYNAYATHPFSKLYESYEFRIFCRYTAIRIFRFQCG